MVTETDVRILVWIATCACCLLIGYVCGRGDEQRRVEREDFVRKHNEDQK